MQLAALQRARELRPGGCGQHQRVLRRHRCAAQHHVRTLALSHLPDAHSHLPCSHISYAHCAPTLLCRDAHASRMSYAHARAGCDRLRPAV
eukprot:2040838-Rhodomonas_salina.2